jgi:hypothetical protein
MAIYLLTVLCGETFFGSVTLVWRRPWNSENLGPVLHTVHVLWGHLGREHLAWRRFRNSEKLFILLGGAVTYRLHKALNTQSCYFIASVPPSIPDNTNPARSHPS